MAMVMPRSFSSGALSIWSKGVKSASPFSARTLVMAAVSVVLPWSMCPIVPMFTWGLFRSNLSFGMLLLSSPLLAPNPRDDLLRDVGGHLLIRMKLHRRVRRASLGPRPQVGGVAEQLGQRHRDPDRTLSRSLLDVLDPAPAPGHVAHDLAHELLGREDLELHNRLQQH